MYLTKRRTIARTTNELWDETKKKIHQIQHIATATSPHHTHPTQRKVSGEKICLNKKKKKTAVKKTNSKNCSQTLRLVRPDSNGSSQPAQVPNDSSPATVRVSKPPTTTTTTTTTGIHVSSIRFCEELVSFHLNYPLLFTLKSSIYLVQVNVFLCLSTESVYRILAEAFLLGKRHQDGRKIAGE